MYVITIVALKVLVSFIHVAILKAGGDILKFAGKRNCYQLYYCGMPCTVGDALLAFWRCDKRDQQQTVTNVMENGLSIQENYDNFKAGEGINLRMKIAISVGDIFVYHLGMLPWLVNS